MEIKLNPAYMNERMYVFCKAVVYILSRPQTVYKKQYERFKGFVEEYERLTQQKAENENFQESTEDAMPDATKAKNDL